MKSKRPIRTVVPVVFGDADTVKTAALNFWGYLETMHVVIPDWTTGSPTLTVSIKDEDGYLIKEQAALAENAEHDVSFDRHIPQGCTVTLTLTGAPGGTGGTVTLINYGESAVM